MQAGHQGQSTYLQQERARSTLCLVTHSVGAAGAAAQRRGATAAAQQSRGGGAHDDAAGGLVKHRQAAREHPHGQVRRGLELDCHLGCGKGAHLSRARVTRCERCERRAAQSVLAELKLGGQEQRRLPHLGAQSVAISCNQLQSRAIKSSVVRHAWARNRLQSVEIKSNQEQRRPPHLGAQ